VPEIASRKQLEYLLPVINSALDDAEVTPAELTAVAVTNGPGLIGSLVVGLVGAKTFADIHALPLIGVNHLEGHLYANWIRLPDDSRPKPSLPALVLIVSGGHAHMVWMEDHGEYRILGRTRDDAPARRWTRRRACWSWAIPAGQSSTSWGARATRTRWRSRARCCPAPSTSASAALKHRWRIT